MRASRAMVSALALATSILVVEMTLVAVVSVAWVVEVLSARHGAVQSLVSETRVVVATMDAYCKHKAGKLGGMAKCVLQDLVTKVALCDESEAYYYIDQAVAALRVAADLTLRIRR